MNSVLSSRHSPLGTPAGLRGFIGDRMPASSGEQKGKRFGLEANARDFQLCVGARD
jgi:hypothetical protein